MSERNHQGSLIELVLIVAAAVALAFTIQAFLVKPYRIPSESMEPTLDVGQRVLVSRVNYKFGDPDYNNIVVFHPPVGAENNECGVGHAEDQACPKPVPKKANVTFIKRVIGRPGDAVSIHDGFAVVNGKEKHESFIRPCPPGTCNYPKTIRVPAGHFFMMGDNRGQSDDSRYWGPVPKTWIIGQAFCHLLASQARRNLLSRPRPSAGARRPAACSSSIAQLERRFVAGADEAGRGCLAGPLVAAAVLFDYGRLTFGERRALSRLDDSKVRDAEARERLFPLIVSSAARRRCDALRAWHRRSRPARDQPAGAARLAAQGRRARTASA